MKDKHRATPSGKYKMAGFECPAMRHEEARAMAEAWCDAWNRRDLESILAHFADDVELRSPKVVERLGRADGWVKGKDELRGYFATGLKATGLRFDLIDVLVGVEDVTILYRRETGALVADTMELDASGRARRVIVTYGAATRSAASG